ncbi:hypothetical protein NDN08_004877 [Rhodosorus marinus]|uniref:Hint domain-containing protein n=1 Tax=Rhodosorus marinus TaxID=101924 RepID=A0AAV8UEU5_9RHOD|nr:hypothetical protein NDN08_004877 [Rhodosorus marinus]
MNFRLFFSWKWLLVGALVLGSVNGAPDGVNFKRVVSALRQVDCEELVEQCLGLLSQRCATEIVGGDGDVGDAMVCCDELFQVLDCFFEELDRCLPPLVIDIIRDSERDCEARQTGFPTAPPAPTETASKAPTEAPTQVSTEVPAGTAIEVPTGAATETPTEAPTAAPSEVPTAIPSIAPTVPPTEALTEPPTEAPTEIPTEASTVAPTGVPTEYHAETPTEVSTEAPTVAPSEALTEAPTEAPTDAPTGIPTDTPAENSSSPAVSPSATPTPTPTSLPVCFPGDATVLIADGTEKPMRFLEAGDKVMVAGGDFSDVYAFGHKDPAQDADFIRIETESGHVIEVSGSHYVLVADALVAAKKVKVGDQLTITGLGKSRIGVLSSVRRSGVYSPHTLDGTIVVNGIEASCHTETVKPFVADLLMAIPKFLYRLGLNEPLGSMLYKSTPAYVHSFLTKMRISAAQQ